MRRFFQNSVVFYSALALAAILLQWFFSRMHDERVKAADDRVAVPVNQIKEHYDSPAGVSVTTVMGELTSLEERIKDGYRLLQQQNSFSPRPEYRIDLKERFADVEFGNRVKRWKAKNASRIKVLAGKFEASFLLPQIANPELVNDLLLQASVIEELFERLEKPGALQFIEKISASSPPRSSDSAGSPWKMIKRVLRFPIHIELSASPAELDKFFSALRADKGYFFVESIDIGQGNDIGQWGERLHCVIDLAALSFDLDSQINFVPIKPTWAH